MKIYSSLINILLFWKDNWLELVCSSKLISSAQKRMCLIPASLDCLFPLHLHNFQGAEFLQWVQSRNFPETPARNYQRQTWRYRPIFSTPRDATIRLLYAEVSNPGADMGVSDITWPGSQPASLTKSTWTMSPCHRVNLYRLTVNSTRGHTLAYGLRQRLGLHTVTCDTTWPAGQDCGSWKRQVKACS